MTFIHQEASHITWQYSWKQPHFSTSRRVWITYQGDRQWPAGCPHRHCPRRACPHYPVSLGRPLWVAHPSCHLSQPPWPQMNTLHFPVSVLGIAVRVEPSAAFYRSLSVRSDGPTILARPRLAVPRTWDFTD